MLGEMVHIIAQVFTVDFCQGQSFEQPSPRLRVNLFYVAGAVCAICIICAMFRH